MGPFLWDLCRILRFLTQGFAAPLRGFATPWAIIEPSLRDFRIENELVQIKPRANRAMLAMGGYETLP